MKRVRARTLALVNWKGVFYERYALDELKKSAEQLKLTDAELRTLHTEVLEFSKRVARMF